MITLRQAADIVGVTPDNLRQAIARGTLRAEKVGRDWLLERSEAERYARENHRGTPRHPAQITSDRLADHVERYEADGATRDAVSTVRDWLERIASPTP